MPARDLYQWETEDRWLEDDPYAGFTLQELRDVYREAERAKNGTYAVKLEADLNYHNKLIEFDRIRQKCLRMGLIGQH